MRMMTFWLKQTLLTFLFVALVAPVLTQAQLSDMISANAGAAPTQSIADWQVTGPEGGDARALVIDPRNAQRLYVGTLDGQIYTSNDGARTWSRLAGFSRPGLFIDNIIIDPRDSRTLYVAAHRHKEPGGFFKSTDGGATWREAVQLRREALHSMIQAPSNPDMLLVGTNNGVWRSDNGGETWRQLPTTGMTNTNIESLAIDPRNQEVIYAGSWHLPFKSTNGGQSWTKIDTGMIDDSDVFAIEIDFRDPDHIIASACSGIYMSQNGGASWRKVQGIPSQARRTLAIVQNPAQPDVIYAGTTEGFWRSTNGGNSWMVTTSRQLEIKSIAVHRDNPQTIYIGTNNFGVMVSRDGGRTFEQSNGGFSARRAYFILPDRERPNRVYASTINTATGGGAFFISNDGGQTWEPSMRNMPNRLVASAILQDQRDANIIYLGTNMGVYRSTDRGAAWAQVSAPPAPARGRAARGRAAARPQASATVRRAQEALNAAGHDAGTPDGLAGSRTTAAIRAFQTARRLPQTGRLDAATLNALGISGAEAADSTPVALTEAINALRPTYDEQDGKPGMLAATNSGLYRTYDPAQGWVRLPYGNHDTRTLSVSTHPQNPTTIWVGTSTSGVLVTRDGGTTWQQIAPERIPVLAPINVIEQDPQRSSYIYVGTTQTLYMSHDGGQRWHRRGGNLPLGNFTSILINPRNTDEIFVGSAYELGNGGVFHSSDAGQTWQRVDPDLPSRRIWALAIDPRDPNRMFIGSHSAGVYLTRRGQRATAAPVTAGVQ